MAHTLKSIYESPVFDHPLRSQSSLQGCQIFLCTKYQNGKNIPNYNELCQMSISPNKRLQNGASVHKIYHLLPLQDPLNLEFWFENKPSGNPDSYLGFLTLPLGLDNNFHTKLKNNMQSHQRPFLS
jgi:hypothetical protein